MKFNMANTVRNFNLQIQVKDNSRILFAKVYNLQIHFFRAMVLKIIYSTFKSKKVIEKNGTVLHFCKFLPSGLIKIAAFNLL